MLLFLAISKASDFFMEHVSNGQIINLPLHRKSHRKQLGHHVIWSSLVTCAADNTDVKLQQCGLNGKSLKPA